MSARPQGKDLHIVFNGFGHALKIFNAAGQILKTPEGRDYIIPAWGETVAAPGKSRFFGHFGKCPPGVYLLGRPIKLDRPQRAYGRAVIPLIDINGLWRKYVPPRTLIRIHGGGKARDWSAPRQEHAVTLGCQRVHNEDLMDLCSVINACLDAGARVWYTVAWE